MSFRLLIRFFFKGFFGWLVCFCFFGFVFLGFFFFFFLDKSQCRSGCLAVLKFVLELAV